MAGREVTIELEGQTYKLLFDLNALAAFGDKLGIEVRLSNLQEDLVNTRLPLSAPRTLLWAAMQAHHPDLTEEDVGRLVHGDSVEVIGKGFFELLKSMLPEQVGAQLDAYLDQLRERGVKAASKTVQSRGRTSKK